MMMRMYWVAATLIVAGAGAVGVSAGTTVNLKGSDTLFDFTNSVISACPGTVGPYAGTGSGNGQAAMVAGTQQVAPMSRFLDKKVCSGVASSPATSEGLVVALDSLVFVGASQTFGSTACNGDRNLQCLAGFEPTTGAAYDTAVTAGTPVSCTDNTPCRANETCICPGGAATPCTPALSGTCEYVFNDWRDVLRVLVAGFDHTNASTGAANLAARDCNSPIRLALANSYGSIFENTCAAPAVGDATGPCSKIRHIFRRDDFSGTTDTVAALLNLPSIVYPETTVTVFPAGVSTSIVQHTGMNPFCNSVRPAFALPQSNAGTCTTNTCTTTCADGKACTAGLCTSNACTIGGVACGDASTCVPTQPQVTCLQGADSTWDPTSKNLGTGCTKENAVYRSSMQDNDPIRRTCAGAATGAIGTVSEDICSHSADLGLVLTMNDVPENAPRTNADRYNATPCLRGKFTSAQTPDVYDAITQGKVICTRGLLCPNGDFCTATGGCIAPADPTGNPQCTASKLTTSALVISSQAVPLVNPKAPSLNDGRSYNQHLYAAVGSAGTYQLNGFSTPMAMTGSYYRIHTNHTLAPAGDAGAPPTCQLPDMTSQIGCLVSASPCSIGYAGRQALTSNANAAPFKIKMQTPETLCVQGHFLYPLSRKLYLNTLVGFENVVGQELALVGCETDLPQPSLNILNGGAVTAAVVSSGFIQIGPFVNNGEPYCEDFNESALCGAASNVVACDTTGAVTPPFLDNWTTFETVCGDGQVDSYEDCDNGTLNGAPPAACSTTCRFNH